jgi:hypothetical protein
MQRGLALSQLLPEMRSLFWARDVRHRAPCPARHSKPPISLTEAPQVGLTLAYPIMQGGLFVAGAWGILTLGELPERSQRLRFCVCGALLIAGGALLSYATQA